MVYGRVYSIRSHQTTDIYIGSTTQILCKRMVDHRYGYKYYLNKKSKYVSSYEILKHEDAYIELIYEGEFESKNALTKKEGEYIRDMDCVNKRIEGRTQKEWHEEHKEQATEYQTQYYKEHKPHLIQQSKNYNEEHKEQRIEYNKQYYEDHKENAKIKYTCKCGLVCRVNTKSKHERSKKHKRLMLSLSTE
jgi:hypothetical protein